MKVAFVHYHLNPGGVTTVIRQQVDALRKTGGEAIVLTGEPCPTRLPVETTVIEGIGYTPGGATASADIPRIVEKMLRAISRRWPRGCDLIHVHNPILAKNRDFPAILEALQAKGIRLLLQIHDFAEDGRPDVYFRRPYPANCHYSVINTRDHRLLLAAGLKPEGLHLLPNMVSPGAAPTASPDRLPFVLYPTRAIRRKNIGEALLTALFFGPGRQLVVTLPPGSRTDLLAYHDWRKFSGEHRLPVRFGAGLEDALSALVAAAVCFLTTSITEGFGFCFLEPWTAGRALQGRRLPDICRDFERNGLRLENLYTRLWVPTGWFDYGEYIAAWRRAVKKAGNRFDAPPAPADVSAAEARLARRSTIDFGLLNEKYQKTVLHRLVSEPGGREVLKAWNPFLEAPDKPLVSESLIRHNRNRVLARYNCETYARRLAQIYRKVAGATVSQEILKEVLLARFFNLDRFSLLKWGDYEGEPKHA